MKYYALIDNGYIMSVSKGDLPLGNEITEERYDEIISAVQSCPRRAGYAYRLKVDLTWEEREKEPLPEEDPDPAEALSILLGGEEE